MTDVHTSLKGSFVNTVVFPFILGFAFSAYTYSVSESIKGNIQEICSPELERGSSAVERLGGFSGGQSSASSTHTEAVHTQPPGTLAPEGFSTSGLCKHCQHGHRHPSTDHHALETVCVTCEFQASLDREEGLKQNVGKLEAGEWLGQLKSSQGVRVQIQDPWIG